MEEKYILLTYWILYHLEVPIAIYRYMHAYMCDPCIVIQQYWSYIVLVITVNVHHISVCSILCLCGQTVLRLPCCWSHCCDCNAIKQASTCSKKQEKTLVQSLSSVWDVTECSIRNWDLDLCYCCCGFSSSPLKPTDNNKLHINLSCCILASLPQQLRFMDSDKSHMNCKTFVRFLYLLFYIYSLL